MASPHLLRPFSARQLSLVAGDGNVMVFAVLGGRYAGPTALVHLPTLRHRLDSLPRNIHTVAFVDEPVPDGATVAVLDDMVEALLELDLDALAQSVPAREAVKRVEDRLVAEGVDRTSLVAVRCPEVLRISSLGSALDAAADQWASPTSLVASAGGVVRLTPGAAHNPTI